MVMLDKRGKDGRFLPGFAGGPGNPFARRVHQLRSALLKTVTPSDIEEVVRKLLSMAKEGDVTAIKELLDRTIGKPVTAVELSGADGEPLLQLGRLQAAIMESLARFPDARIAVACRLGELLDDRSAKSGSSDDDGVGPSAPYGPVGDGR